MKIKTRKKRIAEYNEKHPDRVYDSVGCLQTYFRERKWDFDKACKKANAKLEKILDQRTYKSIEITMYENPMQTHRPRTTQYGSIYSPNAAENHKYFEKAIKSVIKTLKLINTPAEITVEAYMEMPTNVKPDEVILFEAKVLYPIDKPDYDNIGKCYTDILSDIIITDDDIFYSGEIRKYYSVLPRVVIRISCLAAHESDYVYKKLKSRKKIKEGIRDGRIELRKLNYTEGDKDERT